MGNAFCFQRCVPHEGLIQDDAYRQQIRELTVEICKTFGHNFFDAYVRQVIQENTHFDLSNIKFEPKFKLLKAPALSTPLKEGWLIKQGYVFHSWKKRWFVVLQEADQFIVRYYSDQSKTHLKGEINLHGYRKGAHLPENLRPEFGENGQNTFVLAPECNPELRIWYLHLDETCIDTSTKDIIEEMDEWIETFFYASQNCPPPLEFTDRTSSIAFEKAFFITSMESSVWKSHFVGTEAERVIQLVEDHIHKTSLMEAILTDLHQLTGANTIPKSEVDKILRNEVTATVLDSMSKIPETIAPVFNQVEILLNQIGDEYFEEERQIRSLLQDVVSPKYMLTLEDLQQKNLINIFNHYAPRVLDCFHKGMVQVCVNLEKVRNDCRTIDEVFVLIQEGRCWFGEFATIQHILWQACVEVPPEMEKLLHEVHVTKYEVYCCFVDNIWSLMRNLVYTYQKLVDSVRDIEKVLEILQEKCVYDCESSFVYSFVNLFILLSTRPMYQNFFSDVIKDIAGMSEKIPDGLDTLMNVKNLSQDILKKVVQDVSESLAEQLTWEAKSELGNLISEIEFWGTAEGDLFRNISSKHDVETLYSVKLYGDRDGDDDYS